MTKDLRKKLEIPKDALKSVNDFLLDENNPLINDLLTILDKYGGIEEINKKAQEASELDNLISRLTKKNSAYVKDIERLIEARDNHSFINVTDYRKNVPGRIIRVRRMKEQEEDGDLIAMAAAMQIIGSTWVETLDTKGTAEGPDGMPVNIHLGGPDTITGYFGGVGQPNDFALKWVDEFLYYYTNYGIKQVLNVNPGTVLLGYLIYKLGINNEFKISVYMGNDNPYSCLWTLLTAKLFAREDGTSPLIGFNLSNAVNNETIEMAAYIRKPFGFEDVVRLEHHITETWKSIVRQPYDRRDELLELAKRVKNLSAKHEGGNVEVDGKREHPSDILEYFMPKEELKQAGLWDYLRINHLDRYDAVNSTAEALTKHGLSFIAAKKLHHYE